MKRAGFFAGLLALAILTSVSVAQDIIEGDLPPGNPFDGTSDRASMFDLYQVANIALAALVQNAGDTEDAFSVALQDELRARGYPDTRITVLSQSETPDRSCSTDGAVEVRISPNAVLDAAVVVANEYWFSEGRAGRDGVEEDMVFAHDCSAIAR